MKIMQPLLEGSFAIVTYDIYVYLGNFCQLLQSRVEMRCELFLLFYSRFFRIK